MNKKITSSVLAALMVAGSTSFTAFAAMSNGTVVIGNMAYDFAYANNVANATEITAAVVASAGKVYIKDFQGNWVDNVTGAAVTAASIPAVTYKNATGVVTPFAAGDMDAVTTVAVTSVSAINASQIKVVFNNAVAKTSAETIGNYYKNASALASPDSASLQADGKTVIITLGTALANNTAIAFKVSGVKDINQVALAKDYVISLLASDTIAPTLVSATAKAKTTTNKITLTFNEPIDYSTASVTVNGSFASIASGTDANEVVITTGSNLVAGTAYNVNLMNFKDTVGNYMVTNPLAATVTVAGDTVTPNVSKVVLTRDNQLEVTFDKAMDINTLAAASNVKLLDSTLSAGPSLGTPVAKDSTNMIFDFPVSSLTFNASNIFSGVVVLNNAVADLSGNTITATTNNVSVTKDIIKSQIVSSVFKNVTSYGTSSAAGAAITSSNGFIVVKFNEEVTAAAAANAYTMIDNIGGTVTAPAASAVAINYSDKTELVISLSAPVATGITSYMVLVPTDAVEDLSVSHNQSAAVQQLVNVTAGVPVASDTVAPTVGMVTTNSATAIATAVKTITVPLTEAGSGLDLATVVNINNYRLDGAPLPAGSYVTYNSGTTTATINIPAGSIATDKTAVGVTGGYVFNITGIKDKAGNAITTYVGNISLVDDIAPVFTTAMLNTNGTASLGFSEDVNAATGNESDFVVKLNGSTLSGASVAYSLADGTGADAGKYVLSVNTLVDNNNIINLKDTQYVDVNGNGVYDVATDLIVKQQASAGTDYTTGVYNLNNATTLTFTTLNPTTSVKDTSSLTNLLKGNTLITVK